MSHLQSPCPDLTRPERTPLEELCGPHSGFDQDFVKQRARESYERTRAAAGLDEPPAGTVPQVAPAWRDLPDDARRKLVDEHARHLLAVLAAPPPDDRRPIDHAHHLSPPYPDGERELAYWRTHCRRRLDDLQNPPDGSEAPTTNYALSRVHRLNYLLRFMHDRRGHAEPTGQQELARWIVAATNAAATPLTDPDHPMLAGGRDELVHLLESMRARQRNRAHPERWRRGGAALLQAVVADVAERGPLAITACAAVIAAVDIDEDATVEATLCRLIGDSPHACAAAIDYAVIHGLLRRPLLGDVVPTPQGQALYEHLLERVA